MKPTRRPAARALRRVHADSGLVGRDEIILLDRVEHLRVRSGIPIRTAVGFHDQRAVHLDPLDVDPLAVVQHLSVGWFVVE